MHTPPFFSRIGGFLAALVFILPMAVYAAPDTVDGSYASSVYRNDVNDFGSVASLLVLPDGSLLVGSNEMATTLEAPNNLQVPLLRLNTDGSVADSFFADDDSNGAGEGIVFTGQGWPEIKALGRQSDGKLIAAGVATGMSDGTTVVESRNLVRINADGTPDDSFQTDGTVQWYSGGINYINHLIVEPDDKIVIAGGFRALVNKGDLAQYRRQGLARLNADGTLDPGFFFDPQDFGIPANFASAVNVLIYQVERDFAGRYYIVGEITGAGLPVQVFGRLFADGSRDFSFSPNLPEARWNSVALDRQGRITVTGLVDFNPSVAYRVFADGSVDGSFNTSADWGSAMAQPLQIDSEGRFLYRSGTGLGRILADGSIDPSFNPTAEWANWTTSPSFNLGITAADGRIYAGGFFDQVDGVSAVKIVRFEGNPVADAFLLDATAVEIVESTGTLRYSVSRVGSGSGVASLNFNTANGTALAGSDYTPASGTLNWADGETGAKFLSVSLSDNALADGDKNFSINFSAPTGAPISGAGTAVVTILDDEAGPDITAQPQSLTVKEGESATFTVGVQSVSPTTFQWFKNGAELPGETGLNLRITRAEAADAADYSVEVTASGNTVPSAAATLTVIPPAATVDPAFNAPALTFSDATIFLEDGSFLVLSGNFSTGYTVTPHSADGVAGTPWPLITTNASSGTLTLQPLPDGKFIATGSFTELNGAPRSGIARLNADGTLDPSFVPFTNSTFIANGFSTNFNRFDGVRVATSGTVYGLVRTTTQGVRLYRFLPDGSADSSFDDSFNYSTNANLAALTKLADGSLLIGYSAGGFGSFERGIRRVLPDGTFDPDFPRFDTSQSVAGIVSVDETRFAAIHGNLLTVHKLSDGTAIDTFSFSGSLSSLNLFRGRLLITSPTAYDGTPLLRMALVSLDGIIDDNFPGGSGPNSGNLSAFVDDQERIYVRGFYNALTGQAFTSWNGQSAPGFVRLTVDRPEVGFVGTQASAFEDAGTATISLVRYGDSSEAASVRVTSTDGSATSPDNFLPVDTTLSWAAGDADPKSFTISLVDDALVNGDRKLTLALSDADGATAVPGVFTLTLRDDESLPQISTQPDDVLAILGGTTEFTMAASSPTTLSYQWFKDGSPIDGATASTLAISPVDEADEGSYYVRLTNDYASLDSGTASLTIIPDPAALATGFTLPTFNATVFAIDVASDGSAIVVGSFTDVGGNPDIDYVARINADGTLDTSFVPAVIGSGTPVDVALQADGKVVIVGSFYTVGGEDLRGMARLNADGSLDTAFAANVVDDTNGAANAVDILSDGRIVFGGSFTAWNGLNLGAYGAAVANPDGTAAGYLPKNDSRTIQAIKALPDGGVLVSANTTSSSAVKVYKYGADLVGQSFPYASGRTRVDAIDLAPDGDYLFAGNGQVLKINPDGSTDSQLSLGSAIEIAGQLNGKFLAAGGSGNNRTVRYLPNGGVDPNFNAGTGFNSTVTDLAVRPDGKVWVSGNFTTYNGSPVERLALLNGDPILLAIFSQPTARTIVDPGADVTLEVAALGTTALNYQWFKNGIELSDEPGISGSQSASLLLSSVDADDAAHYTVEVSNESGTKTSESAQLIVLGAPEILSLSEDVSLLEGGPLTLEVEALGAGTLSYQWYRGPTLLPGQTSAVLNISPAGESDSGSYTVVITNDLDSMTSDPIQVSILPNEAATAPDWTAPAVDGIVYTILPIEGERALVGGQFTSISDGVNSSGAGLAVVNEDGSVEPVAGLSATGTVRIISQQSDGKFLLGGTFTAINGVARDKVARLNADFSLDTSFVPEGAIAGTVRDLREEIGGSVLVAGEFWQYNGSSNNAYIVRLTSTGAHDPSLTTGASSWVTFVRPQADGSFVLGGWFSDWAGVGTADSLTRSNAAGDGVVGDSFATGFYYVRAGTQLANGDLLVSQDFGNAVRRYALDGTFVQSFTGNSNTSAMAEASDGSLLFGGVFTSFNGVTRSRFTRLNADGSNDLNFDPGSGFDAEVQTIAVAPSGRIWVGGNFTSYNGSSNPHLVLLKGATPAPEEPTPVEALESFLAAAGVPEGQRGPGDDADGDGIANVIEWLYELDANATDVAPEFFSALEGNSGATLNSATGSSSFDPAEDYFTFSVLLPDDTLGAALTVQTSEDLSDFATNPLPVEQIGAPVPEGAGLSRVTYALTTPIRTAPKAFVRLKVDL